MKQALKYLLPVLLAFALMLAMAACSSDILPPKEAEATLAPMPTPTPTPMPSPFTGSVTGIEVNQGLSFGRDGKTGALYPITELVAGRSTAVFVRLDSALGHKPDERDYLELYRGSELLDTFLPAEISTEDCLCYLLTGEAASALEAGEYTFRAVTDGISTSRGFTLTDTRALRVLTVPIRGNFGEISYPSDGWQESFRLLHACFPIADDGLQTVKAPGMDLSGENFDLRQEAGLWNAWEALRERAGMLGEYDLIVGFVNGSMGEGGEYDVFGRDNILLLNAAQAVPEMALCHYMAQAFGVGDEYEGGLFSPAVNPAPYTTAGTDMHTGESIVADNPNIKRATSSGLNASGSLVSAEQVPFDVSASRLLDDAVCFMGSTGESSERYWISSDVWHALFLALTAPDPDTALTLPAGSTHRLRLTGLISPESGITMQGAMTVPDETQSVTPQQDSGSYMLVVLDKNEAEESEENAAKANVLYRIYFTPAKLCRMDPPAEHGTVPFDLTIPMPAGGKELRIYRTTDGQSPEEEPLYSCIVSPTAPVSSFAEPEYGQHGILRVEWDTEDPDEVNGAVTYELYMCYDGVRLLVYRGSLCFAELDTVSLPSPERFALLLVSSDGRFQHRCPLNS